MAFFNDIYVRTGDVILTWDGLGTPETTDSGAIRYNVSAAVPNNAPELAELDVIAQLALQEGEYRGQLPQGATWPLPWANDPKIADVNKLGPLVANHVTISGVKYNTKPSVYDDSGNELADMQWRSMLYPGCIVQLLLHAFTFTKGKKGISFGLDGLQIKNATAPRLDVGGGLSGAQIGSAFGGSAAGPAPGGPAPGGPAPGVPGANMPSVTGPGAPPPAAPQLTMTALANGMTADQFRANGWTDQQMVENGYATYNPS